MKENLYDFVMARLEQTKGSWPQVARKSGVSRRTLEKIARREIKDPGVSHVQALADYFRQAESKTKKAA